MSESVIVITLLYEEVLLPPPKSCSGTMALPITSPLVIEDVIFPEVIVVRVPVVLVGPEFPVSDVFEIVASGRIFVNVTVALLSSDAVMPTLLLKSSFTVIFAKRWSKVSCTVLFGATDDL